MKDTKCTLDPGKSAEPASRLHHTVTFKSNRFVFTVPLSKTARPVERKEKKKLAGDVWCTKSHADSQTSETCLHSGTGEQNETAVRYCGYMDDQFYYKLQYLNTGDRPAGQVSVNSQGAQAHTLTHSAMGSTGAMWGHGAARRPRQVKGQHRV